MFGVLNIDKPAGLSSRQVVDRVQRLVRPEKTGHAGTLDPIATGVLVVCVGPATRLIEHVQRMPKSYRGTFLLGRQSETEDVESEPQLLHGAPRPELGAIQAAAARMIGEIEQVPPAYSALKVAGRRAYKLARSGEKVELQPRRISIYRLEVAGYEYPELTLDIECGSGTYVRSLGRDLARQLGTGAVMSELVRTAIGPFHLDQAIRLESLSAESLSTSMLPPAWAVAGLPRVRLSAEQVELIAAGRFVDLPGDIEPPPVALATASTASDQRPASAPQELAAFDADDRLVAILVPRRSGWGPLRNFAAST